MNSTPPLNQVKMMLPPALATPVLVLPPVTVTTALPTVTRGGVMIIVVIATRGEAFLLNPIVFTTL